jgi:hypothetical protein
MKLVSSAFVKAQREFGPALKTSTNPHFKTKYADLAACIEAVIDALNNNGIALVQKLYESVDSIMVETVFVHESGETLETGILRFPIVKNDPQGAMACLTYARRGSLMAACGIAPEDSDGQTVSKSMSAKEVMDWIAAIEGSATQDELKKNYIGSIHQSKDDPVAQKKFIEAKDKRKAELK